jgi:hypothetical protein
VQHWRETRSALQAQESRDTQIKIAENVESATKVALDQVVKEGNFMFAAHPSNDAWNKGVVERVNTLKGILRSARPEELAKWVAEGVTASTLRQAYLAEHQRAESLKQQLAKRDSMSPRLGGGASSAGATPRGDKAPRSPDKLMADLGLV